MSTLRFIRQKVFGLTQSEFAEVAGVTQASVSRWENGVSPSHREMQAIRESASARGLNWNDKWFFESPVSNSAAGATKSGEAA
jgi:transcriptional regulator with XRE-family HTH domain